MNGRHTRVTTGLGALNPDASAELQVPPPNPPFPCVMSGNKLVFSFCAHCLLARLGAYVVG